VLKDLSGVADSDPAALLRLEKSLSSRTLDRLGKAVRAEAEAIEKMIPARPTNRQLAYVALAPMPLFIVFGIIDNAIMIVAGEYFDATLGVMFNISTMCAAALGNLVSDVMGLGIGGFVEGIFEKSGFAHNPGLTRAQENLAIVRRVRLCGNAVGVTIGCLIGMFPLLFMDFDNIARMKRQSQIDDMFVTVMEYVTETVNAENATLYVVDQENNVLWTQASVGNDARARVKIPMKSTAAGHCATSGDVVNTTDHEELRRMGSNKKHPVTGELYKSVLCTPIFGRTGEIIGVLQVTNKMNASEFRVKDELALAAMSAHISCALERILFDVSEADPNADKDTLLRALKASFEHHQHHLRFASERAGGNRVEVVADSHDE